MSLPQAVAARSGDRHDPLPLFLMVLTFGTGLLDAISFLKLGHVFVANMTGNVVFLGFAVAGSSDVSLSASVLALCAFLAGALAGGRAGARYGEHRGRLLAAASAIEIALVATALLVAIQRGTALDEAGRSAMILLLAFAMGVQNAAARKIGVPDLTTTVLTLTLTGLAADSRWAGGTNPRWSRRLISVAAMLAGALVGGFLVLHISLAAAMGAATGLLLANGLATYWLASPSAPWATHPRDPVSG